MRSRAGLGGRVEIGLSSIKQATQHKQPFQSSSSRVHGLHASIQRLGYGESHRQVTNAHLTLGLFWFSSRAHERCSLQAVGLYANGCAERGCCGKEVSCL